MMPHLSGKDSAMIFVRILRHIEKRKKLSNVLAHGISPQELNGILKEVMVNGYSIKVKRPFLHSKKTPPVKDFVKVVKTFLQDGIGRAVIIDIESCGHWSVVKKITQREIHLSDSTQMKRFNLKRCTTKGSTFKKPHHIDPRHTFFLSRE
jgi:hypothetical protein